MSLSSIKLASCRCIVCRWRLQRRETCVGCCFSSRLLTLGTGCFTAGASQRAPTCLSLPVLQVHIWLKDMTRCFLPWLHSLSRRRRRGKLLLKSPGRSRADFRFASSHYEVASGLTYFAAARFCQTMPRVCCTVRAQKLSNSLTPAFA